MPRWPKAQDQEDTTETATTGAPSNGGKVFSLEQMAPKLETGHDAKAYLPAACPNCGEEYVIGPCATEPKWNESFQCPITSCQAIAPLAAYRRLPKKNVEFFGQSVTCSKVRDPKTGKRCGTVYLDKMRGAGQCDPARDIGGMFRMCPKCGNLPPRSVATSVGFERPDMAMPVGMAEPSE